MLKLWGSPFFQPMKGEIQVLMTKLREVTLLWTRCPVRKTTNKPKNPFFYKQGLSFQTVRLCSDAVCFLKPFLASVSPSDTIYFIFRYEFSALARLPSSQLLNASNGPDASSVPEMQSGLGTVPPGPLQSQECPITATAAAVRKYARTQRTARVTRCPGVAASAPHLPTGLELPENGPVTHSCQ